MRDKANVRKPFRMTAFIRRRRSLCSHENCLWSGDKRFDRSQKCQDDFETMARTRWQWKPGHRPGFHTGETRDAYAVVSS